MKRKFLLIFAIAIIILGYSFYVFSHKTYLEVYVSNDVSEKQDGSLNYPFATLEQARDFIRLKRMNDDKRNAIVYLRGGKYVLSKTLELDYRDSNVTFRGYKNEKPVISSEFHVKNWTRYIAEDSCINPKAKGQIWAAKVNTSHLCHFMYVNGKLAERSNSDSRFWREWNKDHSFGKPEKNGQKVYFKEKEILKYLPSNGDVEMLCIFFQYGVMGNGVLTQINYEEGSAHFSSKQLAVGMYNSRDNNERGYRFENALYLIDSPGEWAMDSKKGLVYFWPKTSNPNNDEIILPQLNRLVSIVGNETESQKNIVKGIKFDNIAFMYTDRLPENEWPDNWVLRQWENPDAALYFSNVDSCVVENCKILNIGSYGITLHHYAKNNRIIKNEIGFTGSGGVFLEGYGPGTFDVNKNNVISRNYIHDHGLGNYWHSPCIQLYQSGSNEISYNLLQRSAYNGISTVGVYYGTMNEKESFFPGSYVGEYHIWNQHKIRYNDFPEDVVNGIADGTFKFDRETVKPYLHTRNNIIKLYLNHIQNCMKEGLYMLME